MKWIELTTFIGQRVFVNLYHVVAIEPNVAGGGSRLRTAITDDKGKPITYVVRENPIQIVEFAQQGPS